MPPHDETRSRAELLRVIRNARLRWRLRLALRGLAAVVAAAIVVVLVASYGLQYYAFTSASIVAFRVIVWLLLAAVAARFLVLPQLRSVSDERVALYIEEHEPSLEAALLSAVESTGPSDAASGDERSAALIARVVRDALERAHAVQDGRRIERQGLQVASAVLAVAVLAGLFAAARGPGYFRHGAAALLLPWRGTEAVRPYHIEVSPGSVTVPRGADQEILARLDGFASGEAVLLLRTAKDAAFERVPMAAGDDEGAFRAIVFKVQQATEYYVESGGVRSPVFRIAVADLPYAKRLDIEYRFPAYTGLSPQTVEDGGDIAALKGTVARLRVFPTLPTSAGRIVRKDGRSFPLEPASDGTLRGELPVDEAGVYHIELQQAQGKAVAASPDYTIQVLDDQPPSVTFEKPGRDTRATSIEELFLQARAADDYGIGRIDILYSVNGGEERSLPLYKGGGRPMKEVSAGHTMYLEELGLQPGDLIAYYARARDNGPAPKTATSDMYFVRIRSFRKDYHAADQRGMPGGGGQQDPEGALSEQQKQVIAATFNLLKDQGTLQPSELKEHRTTITLAQGRLRAQVEELVRRMRERNVASMDSTFAQILSILPDAAKEMKAAEDKLTATTSPRDALPPEQRALQGLQRAEELYRDVQVSLQEQGGGGGGNNEAAEDLADLFQLEMDRLRNQYETLQRGQEEQQQQQLDEVLERLKELAKRQQQAAERQQRLARGQERASGSGGGAAQRQLADQVEEEARRLERLAHEDPQQGGALGESASRLRQAADALRRSASDPSGAGQRLAGEKLDEARRLLQREREDRVTRAAQDARRRAEELAAEQHRIAEEAERLGGSASPADESVQRLLQRKDALAGGVDELEHRLDRLSADAHARDEESARKIADAAKSLRDQRVEDKIRASKGLVPGRAPEYAKRLEDDISSNLDSLDTRLADAATSLARAGEGERRDQDALDRARELARGIESLGRRLQDATAPGAPSSQQNADGQRGRANDQQNAQAGQGSQQDDRQEGAGQGRGGQQQGGDQSDDRQAGSNRFAPGGGATGGRPGPIAPEDARQFRNEARQRLEDARALERELSRQGRDTEELRQAIEGLEALTSSRPYSDPAAIDQLQESAVQAAKEFEFALRREIRGAEDGGVRLAAPQEVPNGFRSLVQEYFRSLARGRH